MDNIKIYTLGHFEITVNSESVNAQINKSKKGCALIQYLLLHRDEAVPYYDLYEVLWPNEESANPESALKTLVSRMRVILNKCNKDLGECILTARGAYQWNENFKCSVDLIEFERLCSSLKGLTKLTPQARTMFAAALELYRGDLLANCQQEGWIITRSVALHNLYIKTAYEYLDFLKTEEDYNEIIRVCRMALEIDAFDERLHLTLMDTLVKTKRNNEALMQYKHATNMHFRYLGMQPPEGIQEFYKQIIQAGQVLDMDIGSIRSELKEYGIIKGAFVCEYAVFKEIYNLQLRSLERTNNTIFIALIMISSVDGQPMDTLKLDDIMNSLLEVLRSNLRKGDTITHYSASQFALLLPMQSYDSGRMVMERIKRSFYKNYVNSSVVCNYRIGPIADAYQARK
jgi:DNA-binding SARP family transcriptional activator